MKRLFLFVFVLLLKVTTGYSQSDFYKRLIKHVESNGMKFYTDKQFFLKQGEIAASNFTLPGGRHYKIFAVSEYAEVTDIDSWVYDNEGELISKDIEKGEMAIVDIGVKAESKIKVVMKNIKSTVPNNSMECRIMVTYW